MIEKVIILDFGSQYTQLIARRVRELNVYCEIFPYNKHLNLSSAKAIILSGSPFSVNEIDSPRIDLKEIIRLGPKALIMFFAATTGIIAGGPLAIFFVSQFWLQFGEPA